MAKVFIAINTLQAIDRMINLDQGAAFRQWEGRVLPHIGDAYRADEEPFRSHMGASLLGQECGRAIWYSFRWATKGDHSGRILRLFNRGHLEEGRFIAALLTIGCQVIQQDANGKQFRISFGDGHGGGSGDGVIIGCPDLQADTAALAEFKTHGDSSFIELAGPLKEWRLHVEDPIKNPFLGKGVREAKFEHYVQMQLYMRKMGLAIAIYIACNKNTDDLYAEIVTLDTIIADQFFERGEKLVPMETPPEKINKSAGFYKCRFCDHRPVCHLKQAPAVNCRTCQHIQQRGNGEWHCTCPFNDIRLLSKEQQFAGCADYEKSKVYE